MMISVNRQEWRGGAPCRTPSVHTHSVLVLATHGAATIHQRERFELGPGDAYLVPAGEPHRVLASRGAHGWGLGFHAAGEDPGETAALLDPFERVRAGASAVVRLPAGRQEHVLGLLRELQVETSRRGPGEAHEEIVQRSLLRLILAEIARASARVPAPPRLPSLVGDALRFIEQRCLGPLSLGDVAAAVHRSPAHVTTMLRRATGRSAVQWIIAGRMAEARRRLLHTDEQVEIIAERVGYADPTHFIRLFRRDHNATPAAWREEHRRAQ